jgi:predicted amidophosphoribosyltransferase
MAEILITSNGKCSKCGKKISNSKRECSDCVLKEIFNKGTSKTGGRIY